MAAVRQDPGDTQPHGTGAGAKIQPLTDSNAVDARRSCGQDYAVRIKQAGCRKCLSGQQCRLQFACAQCIDTDDPERGFPAIAGGL